MNATTARDELPEFAGTVIVLPLIVAPARLVVQPAATGDPPEQLAASETVPPVAATGFGVASVVQLGAPPPCCALQLTVSVPPAIPIEGFEQVGMSSVSVPACTGEPTNSNALAQLAPSTLSNDDVMTVSVRDSPSASRDRVHKEFALNRDAKLLIYCVRQYSDFA